MYLLAEWFRLNAKWRWWWLWWSRVHGRLKTCPPVMREEWQDNKSLPFHCIKPHQTTQLWTKLVQCLEWQSSNGEAKGQNCHLCLRIVLEQEIKPPPKTTTDPVERPSVKKKNKNISYSNCLACKWILMCFPASSSAKTEFQHSDESFCDG